MNGVGFPSAPQVKFPITEKITKMAISSETSVIVYLSVLLCLVRQRNQYWNSLFFVTVYLSKCKLILFNFLYFYFTKCYVCLLATVHDISSIYMVINVFFLKNIHLFVSSNTIPNLDRNSLSANYLRGVLPWSFGRQIQLFFSKRVL